MNHTTFLLIKAEIKFNVSAIAKLALIGCIANIGWEFLKELNKNILVCPKNR